METVSDWLHNNPGKVERVMFNVFKGEDKTIYKKVLNDMPNGYQETARLKREISESDAIVIGAGAGLSTSAGLTYSARADDSFVEDEGWHRASAAYSDFLRRHENLHVLYLELGVGANTPGIVKYPFWQMTLANEKTVYVCLNYGEAFCPEEIEDRSICIDGDIGQILKEINES